jgi:AbrB family looped-hinge helix DNA binding protein
MTTTIDRGGRLVIPSDIRREAAIEPGTAVEVRLRDGVIEIEPQALPMKLVRQGRLLVARPSAKVPTLKSSTVERTRRDLRAGRRRFS